MKSIIKISVILMLATLGIVCIFSEPNDSLLTGFFIPKAIGATAVYASCRLYRLWRNDPVISRYERWADADSDFE